MVSTRRVTVLGTHTWGLAVWMVVRVQSQTRQLPTFLRRSLTILIQNVMKNVSIPLKRRLLTCVNTIWPGVIHVGTVGVVLHTACAIKSLDLTLMRVKAVMKMSFSQGPVMLARISPNHKTITLCIAVLFLRFNRDGFFCPLFKPILCVLCIWMSHKSLVSSFKMLYLVWTNVFLFHPVLSYLIKVNVQNSHWYSCHISCTMCGKLDCTVGGIECLYRHHGALYNDTFKTSLFDFSLASHYNLSPVDIRKSVECLCFWNVDFWESVKCRCFQDVDLDTQWSVDIFSSQTFFNKKTIKSEERSGWMDWWIGPSDWLVKI